jgi:hypothetical protein
VVSTYLSEKYESVESVGVIFPDIWKHKIHVPNHQPGYFNGDDLWDYLLEDHPLTW